MNTKKRLKGDLLCCEQFRQSYELGEITYAYEDGNDIDETEWFINEFYHIYYCPFCGAYIKGYGYGNYEKTHPPAKGIRRFKQRKEEV